MRFIDPPIRVSLRGPILVLAGLTLLSAAPRAGAMGVGIGHAVGRGLPLHERKHDAKKQVEALEEQWRQAQLAGDVAAMDSLLSDDYIGISMTGQVNTKSQQLDRMRAHKLSLSRIDLGEMQVKLVGSIAIVTSRAEVEGISDGAPMKGTFRYTRVYQRLPSGGWKITSFEATRVPSPDQRHSHNNPGDKDASNTPVGPS